jgi:hypothetical protein
MGVSCEEAGLLLILIVILYTMITGIVQPVQNFFQLIWVE